MTVSELIEHLQTFPADANVRFLGYACGAHFYEDVKREDFVLSDDASHAINILAEWN